jgi:hypothetical protein
MQQIRTIVDGLQFRRMGDNGIANQTLCILLDSKLRGLSGTNLQHSSPLCKPGTNLIVLLALVDNLKPISDGLSSRDKKSTSAHRNPRSPQLHWKKNTLVDFTF